MLAHRAGVDVGGNPPRHGPAAQDAHRWSTFGDEPVILAVGRTLTSTIRLLEALEAFLGDTHVEIVFTVNETSRFSAGAVDLITALSAKYIAWENVPRSRYHLVITASENVDLEWFDVRAPILVLPHGIGFHKLVPDSESAGTRLSGLVPAHRLPGRQVWHLVTQQEQAEQLGAACPETIGKTVLGGDSSYDALLAGTPLRAHYRKALRVADDQRLVLITSTWGAQSILGTWQELPERLLAELPADEYRVAAVVHPNVWTWHSDWDLRRRLHNAVAAGLLLIPPTRGWHATLIASDVVIGDHGSVSFYGAVMGKSLLLAAFGSEIVSGTALADLGKVADRLDARTGLREQIDLALAKHDPHRFDGITKRAFAMPGAAAPLLRKICYDLLGLAVPGTDVPLRAAADPAPDDAEVFSHEVRGSLADSTITLTRCPATVRGRLPEATADELRHLVVRWGERNVLLFDIASIIVGQDLSETLDRYPGCRIAAVSTVDGCEALIRGGKRVSVEGKSDVAALASAVYVALLEGVLREGELTLQVGTNRSTVVLRPY
ncbi:hypothetical protein NLX83_19195 [Allokutzneria sp. A3M-2-11 16]|uniref:hypothetical protein n=1 Tax=Allokutzneria sp. A3M-2-11 16 TaxID=2962043 RepID=UPI0020B6CFEC|nr:hypothetical protein [Allokutzneria sp. A3M-2-11 16]MCP3801387.1 hypothetical protein [Allokutzneria sp. A3M-2-11 16]